MPSVQTESDTSDHSYNLTIRRQSDEDALRTQRSGSPFAEASSSLPPIPKTPLDRPSPPAPIWRRMGLRTGSDTLPRRNMRVSFDIPASTPAGTLSGPLEGTIVKRRRRIPVWLAVGFGVVTCTSLVIAICLMPLTIYNYRRIRAQRAARTVTDLGQTIVPLIEAIYNRTVGPAPHSVFDDAGS